MDILFYVEIAEFGATIQTRPAPKSRLAGNVLGCAHSLQKREKRPTLFDPRRYRSQNSFPKGKISNFSPILLVRTRHIATVQTLQDLVSSARD
jgi:hypothetical protein